jgi:hypothetical protein
LNPFLPKAIHELFTLDYGRMNAVLAMELPFTNFATQTTIPYGYVDPPTEMFKDGETQIWKITHNGVDTHFMHFHLFTVQVLNRVGWDGLIKPPDANEVAWKDTVRMNPLEDIIVALKPMKQSLPWELPNSIRPLDVTQPVGSSLTNQFANIDPLNHPAVTTNDLTNFGWEYVWHCHILGHEENDMMHAMILAVPPDPPSLVTATKTGSGNNQIVTLTWQDNAINETGFTVQRAGSLNGPWVAFTVPASPGTGGTVTYTDVPPRGSSYVYRVSANNLVGYTKTFAAPAVGWPSMSADSLPVNAPAGVTINAPIVDAPIFADSFETGLNQWSGVVGDVFTAQKAVVGPYGGILGMAAGLQNRSYVYDLSPDNEVEYVANFFFNPNGATTNGSPVDIFMQDGQQVFTAWDDITVKPNDDPEDDDIANMTHKIHVAWMSGSNAGFSLYIDDRLFASLTGNTSAYQLEEALLGPVTGLSSGASGTLYFDEFNSSRMAGVSYAYYFAVISK